MFSYTENQAIRMPKQQLETVGRLFTNQWYNIVFNKQDNIVSLSVFLIFIRSRQIWIPFMQNYCTLVRP